MSLLRAASLLLKPIRLIIPQLQRGWTQSVLRIAATLVVALITVSPSRAAQGVTPVSRHHIAAITGSLTNASIDSKTTSETTGSDAGSNGSQTLLTVSCPSVMVCYAGGDRSTILATRDGGATWQPQSLQTGYATSVSRIATITCPSVDDCFAYANTPCESLGAKQPLLHTTNGGRRWVTASIPGCGSSLACPNATTCYIVVSLTGPGLPQFERTTDSGRSWQKRVTVNPNRLGERLACPTLTVCYAAFTAAIGRSEDGGKGWTINRFRAGQCPSLSSCPVLQALACPGRTTCYAGGTFYQRGVFTAGMVTTKDGFRTRAFHLIPSLQSITAMSCPTQKVCFALGGFSMDHFAVTTDAGTSWHVGRITTPYQFDAVACPSVKVCYAAGFLGRLMGTKDGGATWRDLIHAIFVSGTYGATQPLHTYSTWFTATQPWQLALGKLPSPLGTGGRPLQTGCRAIDTVAVYVRNAQDRIVAGPIRAPGQADRVSRNTLNVSGRLRLDVVSHCSRFSVRVDGVQSLKS